MIAQEEPVQRGDTWISIRHVIVSRATSHTPLMRGAGHYDPRPINRSWFEHKMGLGMLADALRFAVWPIAIGALLLAFMLFTKNVR